MFQVHSRAFTRNLFWEGRSAFTWSKHTFPQCLSSCCRGPRFGLTMKQFRHEYLSAYSLYWRSLRRVPAPCHSSLKFHTSSPSTYGCPRALCSCSPPTWSTLWRLSSLGDTRRPWYSCKTTNPYVNVFHHTSLCMHNRCIIAHLNCN